MSLIVQPRAESGRAAVGPPSALRPWRWSQRWRQVLFTHWSVPLPCVERLLPPCLEPDAWRQSAWVSLVAFRLQGVRLRGTPPLGPCSNFLELNLRTYVTFDGQPGIFFLRIHAQTRLAVTLARWFTPLPYSVAAMSYAADGDGWRFRSQGAGDRAPFAADFQLKGPAQAAPPDSLDAWLLERYHAFVPIGRDGLFRMSVRHEPWRTRDVDIAVSATGVGQRWGLNLNRSPDRWHYADGLQAWVWPFERLAPLSGWR